MIHVAGAPDSHAFLEYGALTFAFLRAGLLRVRAVLDACFELASKFLLLDERAFLAPHCHVAAAGYYETKPAAQQASKDPETGPRLCQAAPCVVARSIQQIVGFQTTIPRSGTSDYYFNKRQSDLGWLRAPSILSRYPWTVSFIGAGSDLSLRI